MSRRLVFLNLILVALLGAAGYHIRQRWEEARQKERAFLTTGVPQGADPQVPKVEALQPVTATNYTDVAARMLFSKDRNPTVIIEPEVIKEDPVPPFPVAFGILALGSAPRVFMSEKPGAPQKSYVAGDPVGPFKLTAIEGDELTLEWKDKKFKKTLADLKQKEVQQAAAEAQAAPAAAQPPQPQGDKSGAITDPKAVADVQKEKSGNNPWVNVGGTNHACAQGDQTPAGAVVNGFRKVTKPSMFGTTCFWEPAR
ncbi:MAG: hypothetical protein U0Q16_17225 [Bryobacteraceae bacterium]